MEYKSNSTGGTPLSFSLHLSLLSILDKLTVHSIHTGAQLALRCPVASSTDSRTAPLHSSARRRPRHRCQRSSLHVDIGDHGDAESTPAPSPPDPTDELSAQRCHIRTVSDMSANCAYYNISNNNRIYIAPYGHNFRGAVGRSDQCSVKAWANKKILSLGLKTKSGVLLAASSRQTVLKIRKQA